MGATWRHHPHNFFAAVGAIAPMESAPMLAAAAAVAMQQTDMSFETVSVRLAPALFMTGVTSPPQYTFESNI